METPQNQMVPKKRKKKKQYPLTDNSMPRRSKNRSSTTNRMSKSGKSIGKSMGKSK